ncbi:kinase-like protein [Cucurbitaria berberidis CBS 394.84]|uniref:Kinase-like protein n=1 Tax=Cucurbitaria berberidis CBS 394.84 TaxID=1168544 RepID=A0A9P4G9V3_9PLEO|nr:kinase-like protein [Cucurbitaria berberidis CBS 394.84]KAF1841634.1 kinase-like protein [Cucurbitaria berberidis CBS 394.84]
MASRMTKEHIQDQSAPSIDYESLEFLAVGGSGVIYAIDEERIFKEFHEEGIDVERRALERLGRHVNIVRCFGASQKGLILERGRPIRTVIGGSGANQIPLHIKIRWLHEAAEGTRYMHDNGIIHADTGCNNWIIVQGRLKIIDLEGSSIDGEDAGACYEWFSYKESSPRISRKTDIFAFGCAIYEVITGRQPYDELHPFEDRMIRVQKLYAENQFPDVENIPLGKLMQGCWKGTFNSMHEVFQELQASLLATRKVICVYWYVKAVFFNALRSMRMLFSA